MAFSYDDTLPTDKDKMRFALGDTTEASGPLPASLNFSDAELNALNTQEGDWRLGVGAAFGMLAAKWGLVVTMTVGPRTEQLSKIADNFATLAKQWGGLVPELGVGLIVNDFAEHVET